MALKYPVIFERTSDGGWGAYPPDFPGVGIVADTIENARRDIGTAIALHIQAMRDDGIAVPKPAESLEYVEVGS